MFKQRHFLYAREWIAIIFICLLFFVFHAVPLLVAPFIMETTELGAFWEEVTVEVVGAVKEPGFYKGRKGELVKNFIDRVPLLPESDLSFLKGNKKIEEAFLLLIPFKGEMMVLVQKKEGEPFEVISLEKNSSTIDLEKKVFLGEERAVKFFKRKRKLKHGEKIRFF